MRRGSKNVQTSMEVIRTHWMRQVLTRDANFIGDAAIVGHTLNSASFFASANLLVVMGMGGGLFVTAPPAPNGGPLDLIASGPAWLLQAKLIVVIATLMAGLAHFIWAVRQLNYTLAAIGSSPPRGQAADIDEWTTALAAIANPAMRSFSAGVRSYYFTFAASLWLLGPWPLIVSSIFSAALLHYRQSRSATALGLSRVRELLEQDRPKGR
jgi:uncharacterized membrane protein